MLYTVMLYTVFVGSQLFDIWNVINHCFLCLHALSLLFSDVNAQNKVTLWTPLHAATFQEHGKVCVHYKVNILSSLCIL